MPGDFKSNKVIRLILAIFLEDIKTTRKAGLCERSEPQGFGLALRAFISPSLLMTESEQSFYDSENAQM